MSGFTHFDDQGDAVMVDVSDKDITSPRFGRVDFPGGQNLDGLAECVVKYCLHTVVSFGS